MDFSKSKGWLDTESIIEKSTTSDYKRDNVKQHRTLLQVEGEGSNLEDSISSSPVYTQAEENFIIEMLRIFKKIKNIEQAGNIAQKE